MSWAADSQDGNRLQLNFFQVYRLVSALENSLTIGLQFILSSKIHLISSPWCSIIISCVKTVLSISWALRPRSVKKPIAWVC